MATLQATGTPWSNLPAEIRLLILEWANAIAVKEGRSGWRASAATVCREWQQSFEKETFKRLILHQDDVVDFANIVQGRRRSLVDYVWLRLLLPSYDCAKCNRSETGKEHTANSVMFTMAVWRLFKFLSTWENTSPCARKGGLTLEFSAHSPSDSAHDFKELMKRENDSAWHRDEREVDGSKIDDLFHGWKRGVRFEHVPDKAKARVFGDPFGLGFQPAPERDWPYQFLPKVSVVDSLVIRRQFYRHFSVRYGLHPIMKSLSHLKKLRYEPWRGHDCLDYQGRRIRDDEHQDLFSDAFRSHPSLKKVSVFEDFMYGALYKKVDRGTRPALGHELARSSRDFEELHAALNVDAKHFFHAFRSGADEEEAKGFQWNNLKALSMTCSYLTPQSFDSVIQAAARAAQKMPRLETMELWNGQRDDSCIFIYKVRDEKPEMRLRTTWYGQLGPETIELWKGVAMIHCPRYELRYQSSKLAKQYVCSHMTILRYLELKDRILTGTSLDQIDSLLHQMRKGG